MIIFKVSSIDDAFFYTPETYTYNLRQEYTSTFHINVLLWHFRDAIPIQPCPKEIRAHKIKSKEEKSFISRGVLTAVFPFTPISQLDKARTAVLMWQSKSMAQLEPERALVPWLPVSMLLVAAIPFSERLNQVCGQYLSLQLNKGWCLLHRCTSTQTGSQRDPWVSVNTTVEPTGYLVFPLFPVAPADTKTSLAIRGLGEWAWLDAKCQRRTN